MATNPRTPTDEYYNGFQKCGDDKVRHQQQHQQQPSPQNQIYESNNRKMTSRNDQLEEIIHGNTNGGNGDEGRYENFASDYVVHPTVDSNSSADSNMKSVVDSTDISYTHFPKCQDRTRYEHTGNSSCAFPSTMDSNNTSIDINNLKSGVGHNADVGDTDKSNWGDPINTYLCNVSNNPEIKVIGFDDYNNDNDGNHIHPDNNDGNKGTGNNENISREIRHDKLINHEIYDNVYRVNSSLITEYNPNNTNIDSNYNNNDDNNDANDDDDDDEACLLAPSQSEREPIPTSINNPSLNGTQTRTYSRKRARYIMLISLVLFSSVAKLTKPLIEQYLLDHYDSQFITNSTFGNSSKACSKSPGEHTITKHEMVQAKVSKEMLYFNLVGSIPAFFTALLFGSSVDVLGRKPFLLLSILGSTLLITITALIAKLNLDPNFFYLAFGIDGLCSSHYGFMIAHHAVIADTSSSKSSVIFWIAVFHSLPKVFVAAWSIGIGYLIKYLGYTWTSMIAVGPPFLCLIFTAIALPETLPYPKRGIRTSFSSMLGVFKLYTKENDKNTRWTLFICLSIFFLTAMNFGNSTSMDTLFQKGPPLCWDSTLVGYYTAAQIVAFYLIGMLYFTGCRRLRFGSRKIRISDEHIALSGAIMMAVAYAMEANVKTTYEMFIVPVLTIPVFAVQPVIRGVMSWLVGPDKQGAMFTSVALVEVGCKLTSTTLYNELYSATVATMPGDVFYLMTGVALLAAVLYWPFFHFIKKVPKQEKTAQVPDMTRA